MSRGTKGAHTRYRKTYEGNGGANESVSIVYSGIIDIYRKGRGREGRKDDGKRGVSR